MKSKSFVVLFLLVFSFASCGIKVNLILPDTRDQNSTANNGDPNEIIYLKSPGIKRQ